MRLREFVHFFYYRRPFGLRGCYAIVPVLVIVYRTSRPKDLYIHVDNMDQYK